MKILDREIGNFLKPYIVAEVSGNHNGEINIAYELIDAARWAGADAVKFQCYTPDTITLDCHKPDFIIQDGLWKGRTLYELYKKAHTPFDWFPKLFKHAKKVGITAFASVFDKSAVNLLEALDCPAYKIASMEIIDIPLIQHTAFKKKPMIISTGMASDKEIKDARHAVAGNNLCFLHCTSEYPQTVEWSSLNRISSLRTLLDRDVCVGVSDHTPGNLVVPVAGTAMGAAIIEKHLKMGKGKTEDDEFSLEPDTFKGMVQLVATTHEAMAERTFVANPTRQLRRSLYAVADIKKGEAFTEENIRSIRPGFGLPPWYLPRLLHKKSPQNYRKGDRLV